MNASKGQVTQKEIEALENQYMKAIQNNDAATALKLSDETCVVLGAQGAAQMSREQIGKMMENPEYELNDYALSDVKFQMVSPDVAFIAYKIHQNFTKAGKPIELDTVNSSTWVRKNGAWVCAIHTEALQGDPWGQDRKN